MNPNPYPYPQLGPSLIKYLLASEQVAKIVGNVVVPHKLERPTNDIPTHIIYYQDGNLTDRHNLREATGRREMHSTAFVMQVGSRDYGELEYLCQCVRSRMDGVKGRINMLADESLAVWLDIVNCRYMTVDEHKQSGIEEYMDDIGLYVRYLVFRVDYFPRVPDLRGQQP